MAFDFDKLIQKGTEMADAVKSTAVDLAEKGKKQVDLVSEQAKLAKAQRQLGALVYSLAKNGEENQPLVEKYIQAISDIEANINALKAAGVTAPEEEEEAPIVEVEAEEAKPETEEAPAAHVCPHCGAEVEENALFCNHCGAQL